MILELIFKPFIILAKFLITLLPNISSRATVSGLGSSFIDILNIGIYFFGSTPFIMAISTVCAWMIANVTWSLIEWSYKKIPGVN